MADSQSDLNFNLQLLVQPQRTRNVTETGFFPIEPMHGESGGIRERNEEREKSCLLVDMAVEVGTEDKKSKNEDGGSFYDCNICLRMAREPVLTCCGHMFCWACFFKLPYVDSTAKECPVCEGEVTDSSIIPIYGNGDTTLEEPNLDSARAIPPRPKAQRVERVRPQRVVHDVFHLSLDAIRQVMFSNNAERDRAPQGSANDRRIPNNPVRANLLSPSLSDFRRVLSERAASLSSISLGVNNAEGLVEDDEVYNYVPELDYELPGFLFSS